MTRPVKPWERRAEPIILTDEEIQEMADEIAEFYRTATPEEREADRRRWWARWYEKMY